MAAETGKTPGQVLHESLQRSASAESGIPIGQYARWDEIRQPRRDRMEDAARDVAAAERERIKGLFGEWITIAMSEPNSHPPEAWIAGFARLIGDKPQFKFADDDSVSADIGSYEDGDYDNCWPTL